MIVFQYVQHFSTCRYVKTTVKGSLHMKTKGNFLKVEPWRSKIEPNRESFFFFFAQKPNRESNQQIAHLNA